jgi:hypothetical protein
MEGMLRLQFGMFTPDNNKAGIYEKQLSLAKDWSPAG